LKFHLKKIDDFYELNKDKLSEKYNELFNLLFPLLKAFCYTFNIYDDDEVQDFTTYVYEHLAPYLKRYHQDRSRFSTFIFLVLKSFLKNYKNSREYRKTYVTNTAESINQSVEITVEEKNILEEEEFYNKFRNVLKEMEDDEKCLFLLYYYELITGEDISFLCKFLKITPVELMKILAGFRDKNNSKYERHKELRETSSSRTIKAREKNNKLVAHANFIGDLDIICELMNLSINLVRVKIHRLKKKFLNCNFF